MMNLEGIKAVGAETEALDPKVENSEAEFKQMLQHAQTQVQAEQVGKDKKKISNLSPAEEIPKFIKNFSRETGTNQRTDIASQLKSARNREREAREQNNTPEGILVTHLEELNVSGEQKIDGEIKMESSIAKDLLRNFYEEEKERWISTLYSNEEMKEVFSEQNLSSLSLNEYVLLLRRFPDELATHVTRQGVRDHAQTAFHTAGLGEVHGGCEAILKDGTLHSLLGKYLVREEKELALAEYLRANAKAQREFMGFPEEVSDREIAQVFIDNLAGESNFGRAGSLEDFQSVHFATGVVLDEIYGSETWNETFFVYPKAHLVSQFLFEEEGKTAKDISNNTWIHVNEQGLAVQSSIVFLPQNTPVDPQTGSRYKLENGSPTIDEETLAFINQSLSDPEAYTSFKAWEERLASGQVKDKEPVYGPVADLLKDPDVAKALLDPDLVRQIRYELSLNRGSYPREAQLIAQEAGVKYKRAEHTMPAKEYWGAFFAQNPQAKPNKLVFYDGDPTAALERWRAENGIITKPRDNARMAKIHFSQNNVGSSGEGVEGFYETGKERRAGFKLLAQEALDNYFDEKK